VLVATSSQPRGHACSRPQEQPTAFDCTQCRHTLSLPNTPATLYQTRTQLPLTRWRCRWCVLHGTWRES